MTNIRKQGFQAGYHFYDGCPSELPMPPMGLRKGDRPIWLDGWLDGKALARRHRSELNAAIARLNEREVS